MNTLEYEEQAKRKLAPAVFAHIAGGERASFDRITLRPRLLVPTVDMDLGVTLFGDRLFAPVVVGPIADVRAMQDFWERYQGVASELTSEVNDGYLRALGVPEGVESYGQVVKLVLGVRFRPGWVPQMR